MRDKEGDRTGTPDEVRDELITAFCQDCRNHDQDDSACFDHGCFVYDALQLCTERDHGPRAVRS